MRMDAFFRASRRPTRQQRRKAARELGAVIRSGLFRALSEPARIEILMVLTIHGRCDIAAIAQQVPQDRSVVSRHLALLCGAGLVRREKVGRNVFFEADGPAVVAQLEDVLERFRGLVPLCCPGAEGSAVRAARQRSREPAASPGASRDRQRLPRRRR
jgi:DNA-binding transcriptional ArsR family regulator